MSIDAKVGMLEGNSSLTVLYDSEMCMFSVKERRQYYVIDRIKNLYIRERCESRRIINTV